MTYRKEIGQIDKAIDQNRRDEKDAKVRGIRESQLFILRGFMQLHRDEAEASKPVRVEKYVPMATQLATEVCFKSDTAIRWLRHAADGLADTSLKSQILTHCEMHEKAVAQLRKEMA